MCLDVKKGQVAEVATKDIVVYKRLVFDKKIGRPITPYYNMPIKFNKLYTSALEVKSYPCYNIFSVEKGLHSFDSMFDAAGFQSYSPGIVVKCIIPEGAKYYIGEFGYYLSYASDQLIYKEICSFSNSIHPFYKFINSIIIKYF